MSFTENFDKFVDAYISASTTSNQGLISEYDKDFTSPCYQSTDAASGTLVEWRPVKRDSIPTMQNLAEALQMDIHHDIEALFGQYYSLDLNAKTERGNLTLLQALNDDDYERLQKNLIAHVLMKRRLKQPETLFFALTDEEDVLLSVLPATSEVVLEVVGKVHQETVAKDLNSFMQMLTPNPCLVEL